MKKNCIKCNTELDYSYFCKDKYKPDGLTSYCKDCINKYRNQTHVKENKKKYNEIYNSNNKESIKNQRKEYRQKNKDKLSALNSNYRSLNRDKLNEYRKQYRLDNIDKERLYFNNYTKNKRSEDINYKILCNLRTRIYQSLKGLRKLNKTNELIGCSIEFLKIHLEEKFQNGMSWDNYGKWHIDHIKPCASFDLTDIEQQKICFHYTNLQPLWAIDNLRKSNK